MARFSRSPQPASIPYFSRATIHTSACWRFDAQRNLIAGSDGSGLIYRITPKGEGFVLYSAPKREITSLALDKAGNIYSCSSGRKAQ